MQPAQEHRHEDRGHDQHSTGGLAGARRFGLAGQHEKVRIAVELRRPVTPADQQQRVAEPQGQFTEPRTASLALAQQGQHLKTVPVTESDLA